MSVASDYFKGQANILDSKFRSSSMKGNSSDTGFNREVIVREWLKEHLPKSVTPELGGQIIDENGNLSSQIDVVLYNDAVPRFGGNPKSYYFAEGTVAAIQVKSVLTSGELVSAINNLDSVKKCKVKQMGGISFGNPPTEIMTGIFAFETDYTSSQGIIKALTKQVEISKQPVNFICVNKKYYVVYNKGEWFVQDEKGVKSPFPSGYVEVDHNEECIFRMVLALSSEAKRNIGLVIDFQPYFIKGW